VKVSSSEDDVMKKLAGDAARDGGASLAEPVTPISISSNVSEQVDPFIADQVASTDPPASGLRKQSSSSTNQVMTHIELPPYHEP
jgi:hypothetical protein